MFRANQLKKAKDAQPDPNVRLLDGSSSGPPSAYQELDEIFGITDHFRDLPEVSLDQIHAAIKLYFNGDMDRACNLAFIQYLPEDDYTIELSGRGRGGGVKRTVTESAPDAAKRMGMQIYNGIRAIFPNQTVSRRIKKTSDGGCVLFIFKPDQGDEGSMDETELTEDNET